jgi:ubiquitin-protein ligase
MQEFKHLARSEHENYEVNLLDETNISECQVVLNGPEGTPYEDGFYYIHM